MCQRRVHLPPISASSPGPRTARVLHNASTDRGRLVRCRARRTRSDPVVGQDPVDIGEQRPPPVAEALRPTEPVSAVGAAELPYIEEVDHHVRTKAGRDLARRDVGRHERLGCRRLTSKARPPEMTDDVLVGIAKSRRSRSRDRRGRGSSTPAPAPNRARPGRQPATELTSGPGCCHRRPAWRTTWRPGAPPDPSPGCCPGDQRR